MKIYKLSNYLTFIALLLAAFHVFLVQFNIPINSDVAFLYQIAKNSTIYNIYENYYEINPPLIVYIYKIFLGISNYFEIDEIISLRLSMILYIIISIIIIYKNLLISRIENIKLILLSLSFGILFVIPEDFLQREHLIICGVYIYISSLISETHSQKTPKSLRIINSLAISIAICLKPQYIIMFLFLELYVIKIKNFNALFRMENSIILSIGVFYILSTVTISPEYFYDIVPKAKYGYTSYFEPFTILIRESLYPILMSFIPYRILVENGFNERLRRILLIGLLSSSIIFIVGRVGFSYHMISGLSFFNSIFLIALGLIIKNFLHNEEKQYISLLFLLIILVSGYIKKTSYTYYINYKETISRIILNPREINENTKLVEPDMINIISTIDNIDTQNDKIFFFNSTMSPAHQITFHLKKIWPGHFPVFWLLPKSLNSNNKESEKYSTYTYKTIARDLRVYQPSLIVIEQGIKMKRYPYDTSFTSIIKENEELNHQLSMYKLYKTIPYSKANFLIYIREYNNEKSHINSLSYL